MNRHGPSRHRAVSLRDQAAGGALGSQEAKPPPLSGPCFSAHVLSPLLPQTPIPFLPQALVQLPTTACRGRCVK